jgi:hypothetical protein
MTMQPSRFGPKIVKPATARQRANAHRYSRQDQVVAIVPADHGMPASSWWAVPMSRAEFDDRLVRERSRMAESRFARLRTITLE